MSGFIIGFAVLFLMAAGFVWGRGGLHYSSTGVWRSYSVNDFYGLLFNRQLGSGGGIISDAFGWFGSLDLGIVFILIGLTIYYLGVRSAKS